jgi:hypothetical protein
VVSPLYIGIDDTDAPGTPGTNQLARRLTHALGEGELQAIIRHQLLRDPRIPCTTRNGCAAIVMALEETNPAAVLAALRGLLLLERAEGSDPGLCVARLVPPSVIAFGRLCQREVVDQGAARRLARAARVELEGLGGSEDGVIGALAAVGLAAGGDDGRIVHLPGWPWPDPFGGLRSPVEIRARGIAEIREHASGAPVETGAIDVGKRLRPAYRGGRAVLYVERLAPDESFAGSPEWRALKLP